MIAALKAEFRKILTVRSTYLLILFSVLLTLIFAFYIEGWRAANQGPNFPEKLANEVTSAVIATSIFVAIVGVLLVTHEYRYNTITYTLTASRSRTRVFWSKIITTTVISLAFVILMGVLSPLLTWLGATLNGVNLGPQTINVGDLLWRSLFYGWAYSMFGVFLAIIIRNQIGVIAFLLLVPGTVESLLGLLLKQNVVYLPFSSMTNVISPTSVASAEGVAVVSAVTSAFVVIGYLICTGVASWVLFLKRDAN